MNCNSLTLALAFILNAIPATEMVNGVVFESDPLSDDGVLTLSALSQSVLVTIDLINTNIELDNDLLISTAQLEQVIQSLITHEIKNMGDLLPYTMTDFEKTSIINLINQKPATVKPVHSPLLIRSLLALNYLPTMANNTNYNVILQPTEGDIPLLRITVPTNTLLPTDLRSPTIYLATANPE